MCIRDRFTLTDQPGIGRYLMPSTPFDFAGVPRLPAMPAPRLGEHTDQILLDILGLSEAEVGRLHDARVVAGPTWAGRRQTCPRPQDNQLSFYQGNCHEATSALL